MKERKLNTLTFGNLLRARANLDTGTSQLYDDKCLVVRDFDSTRHTLHDDFFVAPTRLDALIIFFCTGGEMHFSCDNDDICLRPGMMFATRPGSIIQSTPGGVAQGSVVIIDIRLLEIFNLSVQKILTHFSVLRNLRGMELTPDQMHQMQQMQEVMATSFQQDPEAPYYHETARTHILSFVYTMLHYSARLCDEREEANIQVQGRNEEYFRTFIKLVKDNFREERKITYYASRMCLTPKYLSTLIRKFSGKGPSEWIDMCVVMEAKNLLRYSDMSIQEVAFHLGFPTQSFFGRYFKAHTGLSPKEFRQTED